MESTTYPPKYEVGETVNVRHENGTEPATITGRSRPAAGEAVVYTVRFADDTYSTWAEGRISRPARAGR